MSNEVLSVSVNVTTVVFTTFPDSLRSEGYLFTTAKGYDVRSSCYPELSGRDIYVCGDNKGRDRRELVFDTIERVEDFLNGLERFCSGKGISFSRDGKIVLGGL